MDFQISDKKSSKTTGEALVVVVFKDETSQTKDLAELDKASGGFLDEVLGTDEFKGKDGETAYFRIASKGDLKTSRLLLIGAGEREKFDAAKAAVAAGTAARFLRGKGVKEFTIDFRADKSSSADIVASAVQGVITGVFDIDKYRTKDREEREIERVTIISNGKSDELKDAVERGKIIGESMNFARDMVNEPSNMLTPTEMANRAKKMAKEVGLKCDILDRDDLERLKMGSFLSVAQGSDEPPRMIVLKYEPKKSKAKKGDLTAFVGKGVTFDTGGISIKPSEGMDAMKYDMTGAATVIGAMRAIAALKPSVPVLGVVAATENMPSGKAIKPGDVVTAMNGKTIEILNTDAEGRLILADAVAYAKELGATRILDMATLTGAVIIALGDIYTAILGGEEDQDWVDEVMSAGKEVGEKFWQLPLNDEYMQYIKSPIADVKNMGSGRKAGTIAGAAFIKEFAEDVKWAHLDIAGTAWHDDAKPHRSKGPSGVAIRTLINIVEREERGK